MKKIFKTAGFVISFFVFTTAEAQSDVDLFVNDMLKVADDFASPAATGSTFQSGAGWFTSAQSLDLWEIDFGVYGNVLLIPEGKRSVSISNEDYVTFDIRDGNTASLPTAFGGKTDVVFEGEIDFLGQTVPFDFDAIDGLNKRSILHPFVQASVGLPYETDFSVRFLPQSTVDGVRFSTYAAGLKHNFNQYFINTRPSDFQFAALVAYSKFDVLYKFEPIELENIVRLEEIEVDANLWLFQLISSKSFENNNWEITAAAGLTSFTFAYEMGGSGFALQPMNTALSTLGNNEFQFKGDIGVNYAIQDFLLSSMISFGEFYNLNLGVHYRL